MSGKNDLSFTLMAVIVVGIVLIGTFSWLVVGAFGTVSEDEVHVETAWGEATGEVYQSGNYWLTTDLPVGGLPNGIVYSTDSLEVEPITMTETVNDGISKDGQDIDAQVSVTYQLNADEAGSFYADSEKSAPFRDLNVWEERVGERAIQSAVQDATASVSALEIVEEFDSDEGADIQILRQELQEEVETQLKQENSELSPEIEIVQVRIEGVMLSDELDRGLEDIAVERTEAERQIIDAEADADAEIARAKGEAEAFRTIVDAYGGEERALQSEWITAIDKDEGTIVLDAEAAPILELNEEQDDD